MMNHKKKLKPFDRLLGNASLGHIQADGCYGRMMMVTYRRNDSTNYYRARYRCAVCGKIIDSGHGKPGGQGNG